MNITFACFSQSIDSEIDWRNISGRDFKDAKWYEIMDDPDVIFLEVQKAFYKEWEGKDYEKGKGYKQFKRWEMTMSGKNNELIDLKQGKISSAFPKRIKKSNANSNWTGIGPFPSPQSEFFGIGRIDALAFDPVDNNTLYAGSPTGGLWKSTDNGTAWSLISDDTWPHHAISDITINPDNGQNIYVATGSREGGLWFAGRDIMKTTDGGQSWTQLPLNFVLNTFRIYRLLLDPNMTSGNGNNHKLIIATNSGIYYSTNGGSSWVQSTLPASLSGRSIYDLEFKPNNSNILYATTDGILLQSTDGGASFSEMSNGPYTDAEGARTAIAVTPDDPNSVYYLVADQVNNTLLGIYKYDGSSFSTVADGTETLTYVDGTPFSTLNINGCWRQSFYNWSFAISPTDKNDMTIGAVCAFRTYDGGGAWQYISNYRFGGGEIHVDMHAIEYQTNTSIPHIGSDGGAYQWKTDGTPWKAMYDMDISELYTLAVADTDPDQIFCGAQDNGGFYKDGQSWLEVGAGDWLSVEIDPVDVNIIYGPVSSSDMRIRKSNDKGENWTTMLQETVLGEDCPSVFTQPEIKLHPCLRHVIYTGFVNVHKSLDGGTSWTNISNGSVGNYFKEHLEIAPSNANHIYASTQRESDGGLYRTNNGGSSWTNVNWPVTGQWLLALAISDSNPNHLYAAMTNDGIFKSTNGGNSWTDISAGLPNVRPYQIKYLAGSSEELYLATHKGIYYKNGSANWVPYNTNMPFAYCRDIELMPINDKAYVATYGRGVWESPLANPSPACFTDTPTISTSGFICQDGNVTLSSNTAPAGYGYQWYLEDQAITGATSKSYTAQVDGMYSVLFTGSCKGFSSEPIELSSGISIASYEESFETNVSFLNVDSDDIDWTWLNVPTFTSDTGPTAASHLDAYIYVESSAPNNPNKVAELISDCYRLDAFNSSALLEFDSHLYGSTMGSLEVQISDDNGTSWTSIFMKSGDQGNQWNSESVDISSYLGATVTFKFIAITGSNFRSDIAIDHVRFSGSSNCPPNYANGNSLTGNQNTNQDFETDGIIQSDQIINANVDYDSGSFIELLEGFEVKMSKVFHAFIDGCGNLYRDQNQVRK